MAIPAEKVQLGIWFGLVATGLVMVPLGQWIFGTILLVLAQLMPVTARKAIGTE
jgi:hypothetical protein